MSTRTAAEVAARAAARRRRKSSQTRLIRSVASSLAAILGIIIYFTIFRSSSSFPEPSLATGTNSTGPAVHAPIWSLAPIPGKGMGVVATRKIPTGKLIMIEMPLVVLSPQVNQTETPSYILSQVRGLPPAQRDAFYSLSHLDARVGTYPFAATEEEDLAQNIFETNAIRIGTSTAVFAGTCKLNHGDFPNADYFWREDLGAMEVHAVWPIKNDEEIVIPYFDSAAYTKQQRDYYLSAMRGMDTNVCDSKRCPRDEKEWKDSDERRTSISELRKVVTDWTKGITQKDDAIRALEKSLRILKQEGYHAALSQYYAMGYQICAAHEDEACAYKWAKRGYGRYVVETGEDSLQSIGMATVMNDPKGSAVWGMMKSAANLHASAKAIQDLEDEDEIVLE